MPDNRKNQSNVTTIPTNGPTHNIKEGMSRMKREKKEVMEGVGEYPVRPTEADCIYYLRTGVCGYGSNCRYNHPVNLVVQTAQDGSELPQRQGEPDCGFYLKTGTCKYGSSCKFHHPLDRRGAGPALFNTLGLPMRQWEKPCPYYMSTYTCKFGTACKFDHPQPSSLKTPSPTHGPAAIGTMSSTLPSTGIPNVGTYPPWPMSSSSYVSSSHVPGPQTYMPIVFPLLQSPQPSQSWNSYMRNMTSVSASNMMVQNFVYNSKIQGELVTGGGIDLLKQAISNLPERPNQPECKFFMSTGICKFGSNCKFHHPKERITHNLGPHGLPSRPGGDLCNYFSSHGICRYGPTCKFDHPMFVANYFFGMPSVSMVDQSFFPSGRNMIVSYSTETSHSKSTKITDWIQEHDSVSENTQKNVIKSAEDSCGKVDDDHPNAAAGSTACELPLDQSE